jgi:polyisoprenoid-binding protein YceI
MAWIYDPISTQIIWETTHLGIMTVRGGFRGISISADMDGDDPSDWSVQVGIESSTLDSWADKRDAAVKKPDYLDVDQFPTITFTSTTVTRKPDGSLLVTGDLSMIGVTRKVVLDTHLNGETMDPRGLPRRGFGAKTSIRWSDFAVDTAPLGEQGTGWSNNIFRDEIAIEIQVEFVKEDGQ